ncbi:helix-turn-helix domain-containing protein [Paenibacillus sp. MDMC362]|uniref:helix-turn-helix domain-containing protein n=1 Tax=Paenibacillus sp. MDMC362 TaxID=2977365 RepID=UPI000DC32B31|nr:helix-turn-helix domain-containing protein [Paenibacillus sp. MDMC362]RAR42177.1 DNA-binding response regulator [Paenibacillus sp. MDMC362]
MHDVLFVDLQSYDEATPGIRPDWNELRCSRRRCVRSSSSAMQFIALEPYTLVIIHALGSDSEGMELCANIRCVSQVPIIVTGGSTDFYWTRKALQLQVNDYLPAPFTVEELNTCLRTISPTPHSGDGHPDNRLSHVHAEKEDQVIQEVKEYLKDSMYQNITLKEIAERMHFNYSYLVQKFKFHEKMTFNEYLLQQRMEKAKFLLTHTDMKIYEIADAVGYNDMDWFYKKFKSYAGVSANKYRKLQGSRTVPVPVASGQN